MGPSLYENVGRAATYIATEGGIRLPSSLGGLGHGEQGQIVPELKEPKG